MQFFLLLSGSFYLLLYMCNSVSKRPVGLLIGIGILNKGNEMGEHINVD